MEFGLLGPLVVTSGKTVIPVPAARQRVLLAALLFRANRVVSVDELAEALWLATPPLTARVTIQNYVKRLRDALGDAEHSTIVTRADGYLIRAGTADFDVTRFEDLHAQAREASQARDWARAAVRLGAALALWRGMPLEDVPCDLLIRREVPRLEEVRLQATEARLDADLHLGLHGEVIAELGQLAADHPLRERLHEMLMLALYRAGRQADALAAYQQARRLLVAELGAEPGAGLRRLHMQILAADPGLDYSPALGTARMAGSSTVAVPRQLPAATAHFTGRVNELRALTKLLESAGAAGSAAAAVSVISGTAGVGKTTLALHWAHQVADRFPDGQLFVNLGGFGPSRTPASSGEVLRGFLGALGVPADRVPPSLQAQAALYRSLLAGRRTLIVLDNAKDAVQVRPLLPGGSGCLVLVTSRAQLAGLTASDGAHAISLGLLTRSEARALLAARLGADRINGEAEAVTELIELCAALPLALAIAAARAANPPEFRLCVLAAELRSAQHRLDALDAGDAAASVRPVFSWSVRHLSDPAARMLRLLGLHPGPDITSAAAASLAAVPIGPAQEALQELAHSHLIAEHAPGRFTFHDLLRAYAAEQAHARESDAGRRLATHRILDHYLHAAHAAALLLNPARDPIPLAAPQPGVRPEAPSDQGQALAWLEAEHRVLLAAITHADRTGFGAHAWQIPYALADFFDRTGNWDAMIEAQHTALTAAQRQGDQPGQAHAHRDLGHAHFGLGSCDDAYAHLSRALEAYQELGNTIGRARTHHDLGRVLAHRGRHREALGHAEQALALHRAADNRIGQARALNMVGWLRAQEKDYEGALSCCAKALDLCRGDPHSEAAVQDSLGYINHHLSNHYQAIACYRQALGVFHDLGDRYLQAVTLSRLAETLQAAGDQQAACGAWRQAEVILDDLHHPDADQVRAKHSISTWP